MSLAKKGSDLKIGDTIEVWWSGPWKNNTDRIIGITNPGPNPAMQSIFPKGYCFAQFLSGVEMTIDFEDYY